MGRWLMGRCASFGMIMLVCLASSGCLFGGEMPPPPEVGGISVMTYDSAGKERQEVFAHPPQRVVAIWQNDVETVLALGAGGALVAAVGVPYTECLLPEYRDAYARIPLRQMEMPSVEELLMLRPDLILGWYSTFSDRVTKSTDFWQARGIHTYMPASSMGRKGKHTIAGECRYILDLGCILGKEARAEELVQKMREEIRYVQDRTQGRARPRTLIIERMGNQFMSYGADTLAADILRHVNGEPLSYDRYIGFEQVVEANPNVVFLIVSENRYKEAEAIRQDFLEDPAFQDVRAVQEGRVYVLPLYLVYASATRTYDGIRAMAQGLYPDLYEGARR